MAVQQTIDRDTVVAQSPEQVSCELDGEVVLMSVEQGNYYRIDEIGSRVWALIETPRRVDALCDQLLTEFDVAHTECEADVLAFLGDLLDDGLITVTGDAEADPS